MDILNQTQEEELKTEDEREFDGSMQLAGPYPLFAYCFIVAKSLL